MDASNFVLGVEMPASQGCGCISEWQNQETVLSHDFFLSLWVPYPSLPHVICFPSRSTPSSFSSLSVPSSSLGGQHSLACASVSSPPAEALNAPDNSRKVGPSLPTPPPRTPGPWAPRQSSVTTGLGRFGLYTLWKEAYCSWWASGKAVRSVGSGGVGGPHGVGPSKPVSWTPAFTTWGLQTPTPRLVMASCAPLSIPPWVKDKEGRPSTASLCPFCVTPSLP